MIIKIEAVPKLVVEDGVEKVVMGENNQPVWDKERALITTKGGNYRRIVTLTDELAAEVVKRTPILQCSREKRKTPHHRESVRQILRRQTMTAKNAEGYPDPTAEEAIRHVMRGGKLDYTSFRTYEELQDYTIKHNKGINTREAADKFIREKMPKESYFQKKILDWIKDNAPNAIAWKEAAGPYSRQGIPDITCIINGRYYGFEVKRPFIGVLSKMQEQTIKQIRRAGGRAWVVTSEKEVAEILLPELTQK